MLLIIFSPLHKCLTFLSVYVCVRAHGRVSVWPKDFDYNQICVSKGQQMEKQYDTRLRDQNRGYAFSIFRWRGLSRQIVDVHNSHCVCLFRSDVI